MEAAFFLLIVLWGNSHFSRSWAVSIYFLSVELTLVYYPLLVIADKMHTPPGAVSCVSSRGEHYFWNESD